MEPDWATPGGGGGGGGGATQNAGLPSNSGGVNGAGFSNDRSGCLITCLSVLNMGLAAMMAALGIMTLINFAGGQTTDDFSEAFLAVYMILFAALLFTYELMWWMSMPAINKVLRKNFGFMYGMRGKGLYLVFVAFLCIGLGTDNSVKALTWATGISYLVAGVLHMFIVCSHPEISAKYQAPTAGLSKDGTGTTPNPV
mmetsp:Transcript_26060/g.38532  ORF Transcript_26060/g.38532 Transcript_26060/m.38532 type:complete len:198 (-) Transcript_26060:149-742(-)